MKLYAINYADEKFYEFQDKAISIYLMDLDCFSPIPFSKNWLLNTEFYKQNKEILDTPRGAGLWLWKPFIINEILKVIENDDAVLYADCGDLVLPGLISYAKKYMMNNDIFLISAGNKNFTNKKYTKKECFIEMNCNEEKYFNEIQLEAGICGFKKSNFSTKFVNEWLNWCCKKSIIDDTKDMAIQDKDFIDHRHDQSILTNLQIKYDVPVDFLGARRFFVGNYFK